MDKKLFFYELEGRGYTFQNKNWDEAKHGFEDDMLNMAWEMWSSGKAAKAQAVPEWVSVDDKLPAIGVYVMVFLEKQGHNPTTYNFCQYTKFGFHLSNVTHWMPLPDAPKAQEQKG